MGSQVRNRVSACAAGREPPPCGLDGLVGSPQGIRRVLHQVSPPSKRMDELVLFITLSGLQSDDSLRRSLLTHWNLSLDDTCAVFLRTDQDSSISAGIESANAAATLRCFICRFLGHLAKDCPHAEALERFIAQRVASSSGSSTCNKDKRKFKNRPAQNGTPTSSSNAANASSTTTSTTFDSAGWLFPLQRFARN